MLVKNLVDLNQISKRKNLAIQIHQVKIQPYIFILILPLKVAYKVKRALRDNITLHCVELGGNGRTTHLNTLHSKQVHSIV